MTYSPGDAQESTSQQILGQVDTEVAAIKSKTDLISSSVASGTSDRLGKCIGQFAYDPVSWTSRSGSSSNFTVLDATNIKIAFTSPASGIVVIRMGVNMGARSSGEPRLGLSTSSSSSTTTVCTWPFTNIADYKIFEAVLLLTPSTSYTLYPYVANPGNSGSAQVQYGGGAGTIWGCAYSVD